MRRLGVLAGSMSGTIAPLFVPVRALAAERTTLAVTVHTPSVLDATTVVGVAKGIFEKYRLDIRLVPVPTGFAALKKVVDGTAQVAAAGGTAVAQTLGQGAHLTSILATNGDATGRVPTDSYVAVVARGAIGIREGHIEDLRGRKIGVRRGSDFHQYVFSALSANGVDPTHDVTIVDIADLLGALRDGSVDAVVTNATVASRIVRSISSAIVVKQGGNYMQFLELQVVTPQLVATQPATVKQFVTAFADAAQFVRGYPDETTEILIEQQVKDLGRDIVGASVGLLHPDVRISKITLDAARAGADFAIKIGALKQAPKAEEMFDLTTLREVEREHPEFFKDLGPIPRRFRL